MTLLNRPYKSVFNPSVSGAHAFNATLINRRIEEWIELKKKSIAKKSGTLWGILIHGNRILASVVFQKLGKQKLSQPIKEFALQIDAKVLDTLCEEAYLKMIKTADKKFPGKFLAVLFKDPSASKQIFDDAI